MMIQNNTLNITISEEALEFPFKWGWLFALGIVMIIFGSLGLVFSYAFTLASVLVFGALALAAGLLQLWHGFAAREESWGGRGLHLLVALAYLLLGGLLLWDPLSGSLSLTLFLAAFLLVIGGFRVYYAWQWHRRGWRWKLAAFMGVVDVLLAVLILVGWPSTGLWVIGLFLAIELLLNGFLLTSLALTVRSMQHDAGQPDDAA
ncbi:MAG: HdeD family acid-resistance protein [Chromatocurvus sp.]